MVRVWGAAPGCEKWLSIVWYQTYFNLVEIILSGCKIKRWVYVCCFPQLLQIWGTTALLTALWQFGCWEGCLTSQLWLPKRFICGLLAYKNITAYYETCTLVIYEFKIWTSFKQPEWTTCCIICWNCISNYFTIEITVV